MPSKSSGGKRGRKPRTLSAGERYLIAEFSDQLRAYVEKSGASVDELAKQLQVCRATLYNYLDTNKKVLAGFQTLKRAHDKLNFQFKYIDFDVEFVSGTKRKQRSDPQPTLPFLRALRQEDIRVVGKKNVGSETLELTVQIRFAG